MRVLNFFYKSLVEGNKSMKTSHITDDFRFRPFLDG